VQAGWYLGKASQLAETYTPHFWWGENTPDGELLRTGPALSWGTFYTTTIWKNADNTWNVSLQGILQGTSTYGHTLGSVGFNGETDFQCITMDAMASHASAPLASLQYSYAGNWNYWSGTLFNDVLAGPYNAFRVDNAAATALATGGGP
jgi:hypothetical protein